MLKRDPWVERLRSSTTLTIIALSLTIVAGLFIGLATLLSHKLTLASSGWLVIVIIDTPLLFLLLMQRRLWKRREALRQRALAGDRSLLAAEQPSAHVQTAPLPLMIEARQSRGVMGVLIGLVALMVLLLLLSGVFIIFLVLGKPTQSSAHPSDPTIYISGSTLLIVALALLIVIVLLIGAMVLFSNTQHHCIEATEDGITVKYEGKTRTLLWSEARFFSVSRSAKPDQPLYYELSSEQTSVLWVAIHSHSPWHSAMYQPTISFEQYQQQMQALLEIIEGKTGLLLYELPNIMKPLAAWSRHDS